jgi:hypothetical protein
MSYNLDEIQKKRLAVKISISICEKVLDNFSNTTFLDVLIWLIKNFSKKCESECYEKYSKLFSSNESNQLFNFKNLRDEFLSCTNKCDTLYKAVLDHQIKGAEISNVRTIK